MYKDKQSNNFDLALLLFILGLMLKRNYTTILLSFNFSNGIYFKIVKIEKL